MILKARDLSPEQRSAIESLLGRPLMEGEEVSVRAFESPNLSVQRKKELVRKLNEYFAEVDAHREPHSPREVEKIQNDAMKSVRAGYRTRLESRT
jgi:hypothetical protein